jgi:HEAT repeat protein
MPWIAWDTPHILWAPAMPAMVDFRGGRRREVIRELESDLPEIREAAKGQILAKRDVSQEDLRALAERHIGGPKKGTAKDAILLLGKLNAVQSIDWLVAHLDFEVFYKETKRTQLPSDRFPAAQALIDIGLPTIAPVLARVKVDDHPDVQVAAAAVLIGVLSARGAVRRLTGEIEAARDPTAKTALGKTLDQVRLQASL